MYFSKNIKSKNININHSRTFVVAEVSANHCGKITILKKLILRLKKIKVDAIKLQAYEADTITIKSSNPDFKINKKNKWAMQNPLRSIQNCSDTF